MKGSPQWLKDQGCEVIREGTIFRVLGILMDLGLPSSRDGLSILQNLYQNREIKKVLLLIGRESVDHQSFHHTLHHVLLGLLETPW